MGKGEGRKGKRGDPPGVGSHPHIRNPKKYPVRMSTPVVPKITGKTERPVTYVADIWSTLGMNMHVLTQVREMSE